MPNFWAKQGIKRQEVVQQHNSNMELNGTRGGGFDKSDSGVFASKELGELKWKRRVLRRNQELHTYGATKSHVMSKSDIVTFILCL